MKIEYRESFRKDLKKIKDPFLFREIKKIISHAEKIANPHELKDMKKLKGGGDYFRIRIFDYRLGLKQNGDTLVFIRILHRKDIYRYFP
ncbi:type II toxin-antitoxin system RelE/ParE family toxin [Candidatus Sumerlaeota bacterium]|nr:type II toxin-antitoxin system RelE/ParE family toxin [Candidatus Sumerlaeota bacterium]